MRTSVDIKAGLKKVPPFPPVAARLLALLARSDVEVNHVADLIGSDPTFTARLLQCVNSSEYGFSSEVRNVRQAVALVGLDRTRQLTMSHAMAAYAKGALRTAELMRCWQHTIATAALAEEIATACGAFTKVAFTAGIMHDIGRLALIVAYPKEYEAVIRGAADKAADILDFEAETFGMHHAEAGRMLSEKWNLPLDLQIIAGRHHDPCEGAELDLLRVIHVACRLADALGYDIVHPLVPVDAKTVLAELPEATRTRLNKTSEQLCSSIEKRILQFDSDRVDKPPESAIPVLVSAIAEDEPETGPSIDVELQPVTGRAAGRPLVRFSVSVIAVIVTLICALLFWRMR